MGFRFDRLGCRVPAIAVSAYTRAGTIVHDEMHHAAVIATLTRLHGLKPLTRRDLGANNLFNAVNLDQPRQPDQLAVHHTAVHPAEPADRGAASRPTPTRTSRSARRRAACSGCSSRSTARPTTRSPRRTPTRTNCSTATGGAVRQAAVTAVESRSRRPRIESVHPHPDTTEQHVRNQCGAGRPPREPRPHRAHRGRDRAPHGGARPDHAGGREGERGGHARRAADEPPDPACERLPRRRRGRQRADRRAGALGRARGRRLAVRGVGDPGGRSSERPHPPLRRRARRAPRLGRRLLRRGDAGPPRPHRRGRRRRPRLPPRRPRARPPGRRRHRPPARGGRAARPSRACRSPSRTCSSPRACPRPSGSRILEGWIPPYDATVVRARARGGPGPARQDQHGRVRDGLVDGALRLRPDAQPVGPRAHPRRLRRRLGIASRASRRRSRSAATPAARSASPHTSPAPSA